jgi:hypothetical protein
VNFFISKQESGISKESGNKKIAFDEYEHIMNATTGKVLIDDVYLILTIVYNGLGDVLITPWLDVMIVLLDSTIYLLLQ